MKTDENALRHAVHDAFARGDPGNNPRNIQRVDDRGPGGKDACGIRHVHIDDIVVFRCNFTVDVVEQVNAAVHKIKDHGIAAAGDYTQSAGSLMIPENHDDGVRWRHCHEVVYYRLDILTDPAGFLYKSICKSSDYIGILHDVPQCIGHVIQYAFHTGDLLKLHQIHQSGGAGSIYNGCGDIVDSRLDRNEIRLPDFLTDLRPHLQQLLRTFRMPLSVPVFSFDIRIFQAHSSFQQIAVVTDPGPGTGRRINGGAVVLLQHTAHQIRVGSGHPSADTEFICPVDVLMQSVAPGDTVSQIGVAMIGYTLIFLSIQCHCCASHDSKDHDDAQQNG